MEESPEPETSTSRERPRVTRSIDYYFSLRSPWAYLGHGRLLSLAERHDAAIRSWPVDYATVFAATGGVPVAKRAPERQAYRLLELRRWSEHLGIPLHPEPRYFAADEGLATAMVISLKESRPEQALHLAGGILRAVWAEQRNIADPNTLVDIAADTGLDGAALVANAGSDRHRETIRRDSQQAISAGVFGAPTYIYRGESFWGQDRLNFLARELEATR